MTDKRHRTIARGRLVAHQLDRYTAEGGARYRITTATDPDHLIALIEHVGFKAVSPKNEVWTGPSLGEMMDRIAGDILGPTQRKGGGNDR